MIKKYKAEEISLRVKFDFDLLPESLKEEPLYSTIESVRRMFEIILQKSTQNLRPTDLIRLLIQSEGLDKPISTSIMNVSECTVEKVLSTVVRVLQSKDEIRIDGGFAIDVITVQRDVGAGKFRKVANIELDRLKKKSILSIPYTDDELCCAKAIVYALAHLKKDQTAINAMRNRDRPALKKRAIKLHEDAGVRLGPCTYEEVAKFESFLDVQIVVISSDNFNKVTFILFIYFDNSYFFLLFIVSYESFYVNLGILQRTGQRAEDFVMAS